MKFNHEVDPKVLQSAEAMVSRLANSLDGATAAVLKLANMVSSGKVTLTWETKSK